MTAPGGELEREELAAAATLCRSLGDPARLAIVRGLATTGPARVVDLMEVLGLAQSTVSKHLACLRDCGLVTSEPVGRASLFRLAQPALVDMLGAPGRESGAAAVLAVVGLHGRRGHHRDHRGDPCRIGRAARVRARLGDRGPGQCDHHLAVHRHPHPVRNRGRSRCAAAVGPDRWVPVRANRRLAQPMSARSMAMLFPPLAASLPPTVMVSTCEPAGRTGLVHTGPEALRVGA